MTGYPEPNYTQVPNALLDIDMRDMGEAELKVTLGIMRHYIGYHKTKPEPISYSQLEAITGMKRQGVANGVKAALARGRIAIAPEKGSRGANLYTVNFVDQSTKQTSSSPQSRLELVHNVDTQKKALKEKEIKEHSEPDGSDANRPRQRSPRQAALDSMIEAIAAAFKLDRDKVTGTQWNEFRKSGSELINAGATPEQMPGLHAWCAAQGWPTFSSVAMAKNYANYIKARTNGNAAPVRPAFTFNPAAPAHACNDGMVFAGGKSVQCPVCAGEVVLNGQ